MKRTPLNAEDLEATSNKVTFFSGTTEYCLTERMSEKLDVCKDIRIRFYSQEICCNSRCKSTISGLNIDGRSKKIEPEHGNRSS